MSAKTCFAIARAAAPWLIASAVAVLVGCSRATKANSADAARPKIDHILLEVSDLKASVAFYRDIIGLKVKSEPGDFVTLEAANIGVFLWSKRWDWEKPRAEGERQGLGMYPHFLVGDVKGVVERAQAAGFRIMQEANF
jgi:predicted enzyme related to lactoylglutathione lyase